MVCRFWWRPFSSRGHSAILSFVSAAWSKMNFSAVAVPTLLQNPSHMSWRGQLLEVCELVIGQKGQLLFFLDFWMTFMFFTTTCVIEKNQIKFLTYWLAIVLISKMFNGCNDPHCMYSHHLIVQFHTFEWPWSSLDSQRHGVGGGGRVIQAHKIVS